MDHGAEAALVPAAGFDLDQTIFRGVTKRISRMVLHERLCKEPFWADRAQERVRLQYAAVPRAPAPDQALLDFMRDECDFAMEHADGSFLDHLQFCYEYSAA